MIQPDDLALLEELAALTERRLLADVAIAWNAVHGRPPAGADWVAVRAAVARLEREGLVRSEPSLHIEVTELGRQVLEPRSSA